MNRQAVQTLELILDMIPSEGQGGVHSEHRDVLTIMPTEPENHLCYQVPALMLCQITIVISPLIVGSFGAGIHTAFINSSHRKIRISKALPRQEEGKELCCTGTSGKL